MNRKIRHLMWISAVLSASVVSSAATPTFAADAPTARPIDEGRPPNIVFVFADDWGWGDLGCYGHRQLRTPNLDKLAREGTLFTQFYVCSGVCSPSRTAIMTGHFPARHRVHGHFSRHDRNVKRGMPDWLDPDVTTITDLLRRAGYAIGHFGKWHLGSGEGAPLPADYGIDESRILVGNNAG